MTVHRPTRRLVARVATAAALVAAASTTASAQAWFYPSFQTPRVAFRDYNFGVVANNGTTALFQWREGITSNTQLSLDAGLANSDFDDGTKIFVGGQYARELTRSTVDQPLDLMLTAGAGIAIGEGMDVLRVPVGLSVGHRFPLEGSLAITPYVHPRLSIDAGFGGGAGVENSTDIALDFDVGASFEVTREIAIRAAILFSGADRADNAGFGLSLTWSPTPVTRR